MKITPSVVDSESRPFDSLGEGVRFFVFHSDLWILPATTDGGVYNIATSMTSGLTRAFDDEERVVEAKIEEIRWKKAKR